MICGDIFYVFLEKKKAREFNGFEKDDSATQILIEMTPMYFC